MSSVVNELLGKNKAERVLLKWEYGSQSVTKCLQSQNPASCTAKVNHGRVFNPPLRDNILNSKNINAYYQPRCERFT